MEIEQAQAFLERYVTQGKVDPASKTLMSQFATFVSMQNRLRKITSDIKVLGSFLYAAEQTDRDADLTEIEGTLLALFAARRRCSVAVDARARQCKIELDKRARKLGLPRG